MIDAALKALAQIFTPPFRTVLLKSIGLAIAFLVLLGIALDRLLVWLTGAGGQWIETHARLARPLAGGRARLAARRSRSGSACFSARFF